MLVQTLFLGVLTSSHATDPSCNVGDEESLLQGKARAHPLQSQDAVGPSMLLETVQGMAKQLTHGGQMAGIPESMTAALETVNTALAMLEPALEEEHAHAQQQIQSQVDEIQACHSSGVHGTQVTNALAEDLSIMRTCVADQTVAAATEERECREWTDHATRLEFPPTNLHNANAESAYEIALSLKEWVDDNWARVESQRSECNDASTFAANEVSRCSPVIAEYDDRFCQHSLACSLQSACRAHEVGVYNTLSDEARIAMSARLAQHRTIQQVQCVMGLVTTALNTNMTIDDSSLESCNGGGVTGDVDHLTLDFPSPPSESECPAPQSDDPQCPEVDLPQAWTGGEAQLTDEEAAHPTESLVTSGFEYYNRLKCTTAAGSLTSIQTGRGWDCVAFDTRISIMPRGAGPRGISFQCRTDGHMEVGLQQAAWWGDSDPLPSQPETWETSSHASFKVLYDAIVTDPESCVSNGCAQSAFDKAIDIGFSCRYGVLWQYYNMLVSYEQITDYTEDNVLSLVVDGNDFKWYKDGQLLRSKTGVEGIERYRNSRMQMGQAEGPFWVVALTYEQLGSGAERPATNLKNFQYITAPGSVWQP